MDKRLLGLVNKMNFAEALKMLLDELNINYEGHTRLEMVSGEGVKVSFSMVSMDTNEYEPHLMFKNSKGNMYFWTPTPMDILAADWSVRES